MSFQDISNIATLIGVGIGLAFGAFAIYSHRIGNRNLDRIAEVLINGLKQENPTVDSKVIEESVRRTVATIAPLTSGLFYSSFNTMDSKLWLSYLPRDLWKDSKKE